MSPTPFALLALLAPAPCSAAAEPAAPRYMSVFGALADTPLAPSGNPGLDEVLGGLKTSPPADALMARRLEPLATRLDKDNFDLRDALAPAAAGPGRLTEKGVASLRSALKSVLKAVAKEKAQVLSEIRISRGDWKAGVAYARLKNFILARSPFLTSRELDELHAVEQRTGEDLDADARSRAHLLAVNYFMGDLFAPELAAKDESAILSAEYLFNRAQRQEDARRSARSLLLKAIGP